MQASKLGHPEAHSESSVSPAVCAIHLCHGKPCINVEVGPVMAWTGGDIPAHARGEKNMALHTFVFRNSYYNEGIMRKVREVPGGFFRVPRPVPGGFIWLSPLVLHNTLGWFLKNSSSNQSSSGCAEVWANI